MLSSSMIPLRRWPAAKFILPVTAVSFAIFYCKGLNVGPVELLRAIGGGVALWLPLGGWLYLLLDGEVPDRTLRLAYASGGAYALTTVLYFGAATLRCEWLFYFAQAVAIAGLVGFTLAHRQRLRRFAQSFARFDWVLAVLIAASMVVNIPVQSVWRKDAATGSMLYSGFQDQLYHVGQAYELWRHIPPRQAMIRGGSPERAYHHFMGLTTMLVGRYTAQPDLLRAHLTYHYAVIQILICLLLYGIAKTLAGSPVAGYCAAGLMYLAVAPAPNLWPIADWETPDFYFTLFPHLSSGLDPVALASPQMYSGLVVLFTGLLGFLLALEGIARRHKVSMVFWTTALIFASLVRFRIHIAVAVVPPFLLVALYLWRKHRRLEFLNAAAGAILLAGLLYLEMRSPVYLAGSSGVRLGYSGLTGQAPFLSGWPFAFAARDWLKSALASPELMKWAWEAISIVMFSMLNIVGIPLLAASAVYFSGSRARSLFAPFSFLVLFSVAVSMGAAILLTSEYDKVSVGIQLPLHTRWYLFPFAGVALWSAWQLVRKRVSGPAWVWPVVASIVLVAGLSYRLAGPLSPLLRVVVKISSIVVSAEEWSAFSYLKTHTPTDSVILANRSWPQQVFLLSGLTGRASFLEAHGNPVDEQALRLNPQDDRGAMIAALSTATTGEQFCRLLRSTPITHLFEYQDRPWPRHPADCLKPVWSSRSGKIVIWQVIPTSQS